MGYERIAKPEGPVYHYTRRENLERILSDGCLRRGRDTECWVCASLEDTKKLIEKTVMREGMPYYKVGGSIGYYPPFVPEDYVILKLKPRYQSGQWVRWNQETPPGSPPALIKEAYEFSHLKMGYRGDLKFWEQPEIMEAVSLFPGQKPEPEQKQTVQPEMSM